MEVAIENVNLLRLLVSSEAGMGKTTFCATAEDDPCTSRCLIVSLAGNPLVLAGRTGRRPIVWVPERSLRELVPLLAWIKAGQPDSKIREGLPSLLPGELIRTVCVDTLTEYQRIQAVDIEKDLGELFVTHKMTYPEWGLMWGRSVNIARFLTQESWPTHLIFTAQIKQGEEGYEPMLWGQSDFEIPAYVYAHGWLTLGQNAPRGTDARPDERVMIFKEGYMMHRSLKWQYAQRIPQVVVNPTIPMLAHVVGGKCGQRGDSSGSQGVAPVEAAQD